jgi:hypothetical protein
MVTVRGLMLWGWAGVLAMGSLAQGQTRPYIGYAYPAGGRQGTTVSVKLGGQGLNDIDAVLVTGTGVSAKVVDIYKQLGDDTLLREQLAELKKVPQPAAGSAEAAADRARVLDRVQKRLDERVNRPACVSISIIVFIDVTIAPDAAPGARELRLASPAGVSNPLPFYIGQLPECARKPMRTCEFQVLGKEEQALRKRPADEAEQRIAVPCTANGQIAPGEVNAYRFEARRGQRLVLAATARQMIPFIADAVPGWFQPILAVADAQGNEMAYSDGFRFKPDPTLCFDVPRDGEYVFTIYDAIYRGREDFVYRVTIGELPYVTSIFPLGGRAGEPVKIDAKGWNLEKAELAPPPADAGPGVHWLAAIKDGVVSNRVPFALDTLPECVEREPNNTPATAQRVSLPVIVNGRMDRPNDEDVFRIEGTPGDTIVADVIARRLDSPLDSILKVTDSAGTLLALNDDHLDPGGGIHTHHADSYLMVKLPADGICFVHLTDTARRDGEAYAYRLRLSAPRPDFALRVAPSSVALRSKATASLAVYVIRLDGFAGDIKLGLKDPPKGFEAPPVVLAAAKESTRLTVKTTLKEARQPVNLVVEGRAKIGDRDVVHEAVPAEDRMQAFLWRHLVPAEDLKAVVLDASNKPPLKRIPPVPPAPKEEKTAIAAAGTPADGMQDMASASPAAAKPDKAAPAAPATPAATKQEKAAPAAPPPPAAEKQVKAVPPASPPPAGEKQVKADPAASAPPADGMQDMGSMMDSASPAAGKPDKAAPATPASPAAAKQEKANPAAPPPPAVEKQVKAVPPASPPPAGEKQEKAAPAPPPAGGKPDKAAPAAPAPPTAGKPDPAARAAPVPPAAAKPDKAKPAAAAPEKPKFTRQQVEGRLRQIKILYEDWLLTDEFYHRKVAECEAGR